LECFSLIVKGGLVMILLSWVVVAPPSFCRGPLEIRLDFNGCPGDFLFLKGQFSKALERCEAVRHPIGDVFH
jgi:hypothetical protein